MACLLHKNMLMVCEKRVGQSQPLGLLLSIGIWPLSAKEKGLLSPLHLNSIVSITGKIVAFSIRYFTQIRKNHTYFRMGDDFLVFAPHVKWGKIPTTVVPRHDEVPE